MVHAERVSVTTPEHKMVNKNISQGRCHLVVRASKLKQSKYWNSALVTAAIADNREAFHNGRKWRVVQCIRHLEWGI